MADAGARRARVPWLRWLPNGLTTARMAALPVLVVVLWQADGPTSLVGGLIFGAVAATDWLDGALARALRAESRYGRLVDPLADRLLVGVGLVGLMLLDRIHWSAPLILIARDLVLVGGFLALTRRGLELRVDFAGKASSALTMFATAGCILLDQLWLDVLMWIAVGMALATLVRYCFVAARTLRSHERGSASA